MQLTPQMFMPLHAGPELDRAVRKWVLKSDSKGKAPAYSTSPERAFDLLHHLPLTVGHYAPNSEGWTPERPFFATFNLGPASDPVVFNVTARTPEVALCKAALLYVAEGGDNPEPKQPDSDALPRED